MEYRTIDMVLVSAKGLKKATLMGGRMDVYAVASIMGTTETTKIQKLRTTVDKNGDSDPTWNFPMKFMIDEAAALQNQLTLVVKIKAVKMMFGDKKLGEVCVPIKALMDNGLTNDNNDKVLQSVSQQIRTVSGKPKGVLTFWYEIGDKFSDDQGC